MMYYRIVLVLVWLSLITGEGCEMSTGIPKTAKPIVPTKNAVGTRVLWTYALENVNIGSALIKDGYAYYDIWTGDGKSLGIQAYNLQRQSVRWTVPSVTYKYLLFGAGRLFLAPPEDAVDGFVTAINVDNGEMVWSTPPPTAGHNYEIAYGGGVLFVGYGNIVYGIDADNGNILWQTILPPNLRVNSAWFGGSTVYGEYGALEYHAEMLFVRLSTRDRGAVIALNAENGSEIWRVDFEIHPMKESGPWMVASQPVFLDRSMFFVDWEEQAYMVETTTGKLLWQDEAKFPDVKPLTQCKQVYIPYYNGLRSLDIFTGDILWDKSLNLQSIRSPLYFVDNSLVAVLEGPGEYSELVRFDTQTGQSTSILDLSTVDKCVGCVMAMEVTGQTIYIVFRHSIVAIDLLP